AFRLDNGCACRKPKSGRIGDVARQPGRATRCVRSAEPGARPAHPMIGAFAPYCNSERTLSGHDADARRTERRYGPRTRAASFHSTARQTNSPTERPVQWVCRGCPWLVIVV